MQDKLVDLLETLERADPGRRPEVRDLINKGDNQSVVDRRNLINDAFNNELIVNAANPLGREKYTTVPENIQCYLTIKGVQYLNQLRIEKSIEQLDASIKQFNESSDKSSKKMIELTFAIYIFTIIVVALPIYEKIIQLFKISPFYEIIWLFVSVVFIAAFMSVWFYKIYGTSKELK